MSYFEKDMTILINFLMTESVRMDSFFIRDHLTCKVIENFEMEIVGMLWVGARPSIQATIPSHLGIDIPLFNRQLLAHCLLHWCRILLKCPRNKNACRSIPEHMEISCCCFDIFPGSLSLEEAKI